MTNDARCARCGAPLDPDASACPACLLELALSTPPDDTVAEEVRPERELLHGRSSRTPELAAGALVGPYRILRTLGEGGMGSVYLAEQSAPVSRRVALKVIRPGLDSRRVVGRFEAERRALARMDHPAIATVYDAGATGDGRPYFAMEYVEGEPITGHCDDRRLDTRERLELFLQVCDGVQHAHQRGIIHRDIKPSNVLVGLRDAHAVPKIIDFGVAKAIEQRQTERTLFTELGMIVGTPEYMSPEQAELDPLEVDTRTDVYSLGVLLYELLTGELPCDPRALRSSALGEILRRIREDVPARPSTRIRELGDRATGSAGRRRTDPALLSRQLSGDLDLITMKALEKERGRRYGSPSELAADLRRHLHDEPVLARPPSAAYLLRKLIVRHKLPAAFAAVLLVTLLGFGVAMSVLFGRSQAHLRRALAAEAGAQREAASLARVSDFLVGVFEVSDPGQSRGNSVTARELLDRAAARIEGELAGQPAVQSKLMNVMGNVYRSLGLYPEGEKLLRQAVERERAGGPSEALATALVDLAAIEYKQGRHDEARAGAREALEIQQARLGPDEPQLATTLETLGMIDWSQGRLAEAEPSLVRSLEIRERALGAESAEVAQASNNLGNLYLAQGRHADAESAFLRSLEIRERVLGADDPAVARVLTNLAETYSRQGRFAEAEPLHQRAIAIKEKTLGADHPDLAFSFNNLGILYQNLKRYDEAEGLYRRALAIREAKLPADHPLIAWTWDNLAYAYLNHGKLADAEDAFARAFAVARRAGAEGTAEWAGLLNNFALLRGKQQRYADAERLFSEAASTWERTLGPKHPRLAYALYNLAMVAKRTGRLEESRRYFARALAIREAALGPDHPLTRSTRDELAALGAEAASPSPDG